MMKGYWALVAERSQVRYMGSRAREVGEMVVVLGDDDPSMEFG